MDDQTQNSSQEGRTIGMLGEGTSTWDGQQSYDDTCAIRCQEFILEQYTGKEIDEEGLVKVAAEKGWYTSGEGTPPEHTGSLLELYGVPVTQYEEATTFDLANELSRGHKVIIGIDSGELWGEEDAVLSEVAASADVDGADHAVVVSGIDTTDPENPQVIISDPGTGEATARYPLDRFLAAWGDSDFTITATQEPAPGTLPEMANFDYESGHLSQIAGIPFDRFLTYQFQPQEFLAAVNDSLGQTYQRLEGEAQQLAASTAHQEDGGYAATETDGETTEEETYLEDHFDYGPF